MKMSLLDILLTLAHSEYLNRRAECINADFSKFLTKVESFLTKPVAAGSFAGKIHDRFIFFDL